MCRQITTNQTKNHTQPQDDPQIPQPDLRFVKAKNRKPDTQRGKSPNKNTHKKDLPMDTAVLPLCHTQKHAKINFPPRHSVKHRNRNIVYTVVGIEETCTWSRAYENCLSQHPLRCTCAEGHNAKDLNCPSSVDRNVAVVVAPSTPPAGGGRRCWRSGRFADQV